MDADAQLQRAIDLHKAGRLDEAEPLYRAFVQLHPDHGETSHNLGALLAQRGEMQQSLPFFQKALQADLSVGQYWISYARALLSTGRGTEALRLLQRGQQRGLSGPVVDALTAEAMLSAGRFEDAACVLKDAATRQPDNAPVFSDLGYALTALGRFDEAIAAYRRALAIDPDFATAHFRLGSVLSENGEVPEGFVHYMRHAALIHGGSKAPASPQPEPEHKRKHDREQREYLADRRQNAARPHSRFHLADGERLSGPAINPANATPALQERWRSSRPQMVVMDDFLTPAALEKLRNYCAQSTIWHRIYDAGYIGATPQDGFACPLLAQIVEEIIATFPAMIDGHGFHYLGAFKYDSELSTGTNTHADNSAVNVNFYIAPDDANLDPQTGGMDIWDVAAPPEEDMRKYNGNENLARDFLARSKARVTRVPHRSNRAVIFCSDLFHKTSDCNFREGYLNKRINVSLLFGQRGEPTR